MSLTLATNVASINTQKWLTVSGAGQSKALEQLSSGSKINKAADDAAGSAISTKLNVKAASISKAIDNGNQAIALLQTAESGLSTIADILTRLKELATEAASDNNATDRSSLQAERVQLELQINNIANNTKYGATNLLNANMSAGTMGTAIVTANGIAGVASSFTMGANAIAGNYTITTAAGSTLDVALTLTNTDTGTSQTVEVDTPAANATTNVNFAGLGMSITVNENLGAATIGTANNGFVVAGTANAFTFQLGDMSASENTVSVTLSSATTTNLQLTVAMDAALVSWSGNGTVTADRTAAQAYLDKLNLAGAAIDYINTQKASIGASQNQINYQLSNMANTLQNTKAASSTIKDTDYAASMSEFTKFQVMTQAGVAMLAQSNQLPQQILSLLKG